MELYKILIKSLSTIHTVRESENIAKIYLQDRFNINFNQEIEITELMENFFRSDLKRLIDGEPVQYVVGKAFFYDSFFKVNNSVLIPRPETELLVHECISICKNLGKGRILEIGSGSGCIALSIAKELKNVHITSIDISSKALLIANKNKEILDIENVEFKKIDFLNKLLWDGLGKFDLIVSNPPYIKSSEKELMGESTLQYEPHLALFPKHDDYLIFYKYIFEFAKTHLNKNGTVACELNEFSVNDLIQEISLDNSTWEIINDFQEKPRVLKAIF